MQITQRSLKELTVGNCSCGCQTNGTSLCPILWSIHQVSLWHLGQKNLDRVGLRLVRMAIIPVRNNTYVYTLSGAARLQHQVGDERFGLPQRCRQ